MLSKRLIQFSVFVLAIAASVALAANAPARLSPTKYRVCAKITQTGNVVFNAPAITVAEGETASVSFDSGHDTYQLEVIVSVGNGQHAVSVLETKRSPSRLPIVSRAPKVLIETGTTATVKIDGNGFDVRVESST